MNRGIGNDEMHCIAAESGSGEQRMNRGIGRQSGSDLFIGLAALSGLCQDYSMKHFFLACLFPVLLTAQSMELTEQLGKTVLYGDIALSPDGTHVAWVQSTAATTSKQTYVRGTSGNGPATMVNVGNAAERID